MTLILLGRALHDEFLACAILLEVFRQAKNIFGSPFPALVSADLNPFQPRSQILKYHVQSSLLCSLLCTNFVRETLPPGGDRPNLLLIEVASLRFAELAPPNTTFARHAGVSQSYFPRDLGVLQKHTI